MPLRKRRLIRPTDKLPTKAQRDAAEAERVANVSNQTAEPLPATAAGHHLGRWVHEDDEPVTVTAIRPIRLGPLSFGVGDIAIIGKRTYNVFRDSLVEIMVPPAPDLEAAHSRLSSTSAVEALTRLGAAMRRIGAAGVSADELGRRTQALARPRPSLAPQDGDRHEFLRQAYGGQSFQITHVEIRSDSRTVEVTAVSRDNTTIKFSVDAAYWHDLQDTGSLAVDQIINISSDYEVTREIPYVERDFIGGHYERRSLVGSPPLCSRCGRNHFGHDWCDAHGRCPGCGATTRDGGACPDCYGGVG